MIQGNIPPPSGAASFKETFEPRIGIVRNLRKGFSPNFINLSSVASSTALKEFLGAWDSKSASTVNIAPLQPIFAITAYGKPIPDIPVSLFSGETLIGEAVTDKNGEVKFNLNFDSPGVYTFTAIIGKTKPLFALGNSRAYTFSVTVWYVVIQSKNLTDVWARYVGRSFFRSLPLNFATEMPSSVVGLAGHGVGFVELVPCIAGQTVSMEVGIDAWCNTPEAYPSADKCCEYAKNTWWQLDVYATSDPSQINATRQGSNHLGGGKVQREYHLKYAFSSSASFTGRFLKAVRCPWQQGTAPMDP